MIIIEHPYCTDATITYYSNNQCSPFTEEATLSMDDIAEHVATRLVRDGFNYADVCNTYTGEVLMIVRREEKE